MHVNRADERERQMFSQEWHYTATLRGLNSYKKSSFAHQKVIRNEANVALTFKAIRSAARLSLLIS